MKVSDYCEAEFLQPGDKTLFGKVTKVTTEDQMTHIEFETGDYLDTPDFRELVILDD